MTNTWLRIYIYNNKHMTEDIHLQWQTHDLGYTPTMTNTWHRIYIYNDKHMAQDIHLQWKRMTQDIHLQWKHMTQDITHYLGLYTSTTWTYYSGYIPTRTYYSGYTPTMTNTWVRIYTYNLPGTNDKTNKHWSKLLTVAFLYLAPNKLKYITRCFQ